MSPPRVGISAGGLSHQQRAALVVLLVDDDPDCRMIMRDALADCGVPIEVHEVCSGEQALEFLQRGQKYINMPRPELIYLDIEMPGGIDGLETLRRIRSIPELRDIPVVMMSGLCGEPEMKKAAEYGANSYTVKPASAEEFLRTVLVSTNYWLTVHQYPEHHIAQGACRR
jgi:two-component system, response regulator